MTGQLAPLARHFFGRFFDNELVSAGAEMHVTVTKLLALLATPGLLLPLFRHNTYLDLDLGDFPAAVRDGVVWFDRSFFITFAMLVMGAVTVVEWDALFPDRRDYATLIPLPIRVRTIFAAKVLSLLLFLVLFTAAVNASSTLLYPVIAGTATPAILARRILAHATAILGASAFVFLFFVALEGVLINLLSHRWFRRVTVYVQFLAIFALLAMFFLFPTVASSLRTLRQEGSSAMFAYPPVWFLGVYETVAGSTDPFFHAMATWAARALVAVTFVAAAAYALSYRRHVRRTLETLEGFAGGRTWIDALLSRAAGLITRHPQERAVLAFTAKTMARSGKHRIFLGSYVGVGFAFVLQAFVDSRRGVDWLSLPLVLLFFVLSGMRFIFTVPAELPANWVFRLAENDERPRALEGARKAMLACGVAPLVACVAPVYFFVWNPGRALLSLLFIFVMAVLLVECLLAEFLKIPFTCSYLPGKANVTALWVFYWAAFTTYAYTMASLHQWMLAKPARLVVFYALVAVALAAFHQRRRRRQEFALVFEDKPEPVVRTLGLSEFGWSFVERAQHSPARALPGKQ